VERAISSICWRSVIDEQALIGGVAVGEGAASREALELLQAINQKPSSGTDSNDVKNDFVSFMTQIIGRVKFIHTGL
jgi:hypothetical protein